MAQAAGAHLGTGRRPCRDLPGDRLPTRGRSRHGEPRERPSSDAGAGHPGSGRRSHSTRTRATSAGCAPTRPCPSECGTADREPAVSDRSGRRQRACRTVRDQCEAGGSTRIGGVEPSRRRSPTTRSGSPGRTPTSSIPSYLCPRERSRRPPAGRCSVPSRTARRIGGGGASSNGGCVVARKEAKGSHAGQPRGDRLPSRRSRRHPSGRPPLSHAGGGGVPRPCTRRASRIWSTFPGS